MKKVHMWITPLIVSPQEIIMVYDNDALNLRVTIDEAKSI